MINNNNTKTPSGELIRRFRKSKKLTLIEFANSIGLNSAGQISGWERDQHSPSYANLLKIREVHNLDLTVHGFDSNQNQDYPYNNYPNDDLLLEENSNNSYQQWKEITMSVSNTKSVIKVNVSNEFLEKLGIADLKKIRIMEVVGDTMAPDIIAGDLIVIEENDIDLYDGPTYLIKNQNGLMLRKVIFQNGKKMLYSNNQQYPAMPINEGYNFTVIGRVARLIKVTKV